MNKTQLTTILAAAIGGLPFANQSQASPVQWTTGPGANGHFYDVIASTGINWQDAQAAAVSAGGYLATITSAAENSFVFSLADQPQFWYVNQPGANIGPWLGGFQPAGSPEPGGGYQWVTGEPFVYTDWSSGEPNNSSNTESRIHFFKNPAPGRSQQWNDVSDFVLINGYVVESVPEPSSIVLGILGLTSLASMRRRNRNTRAHKVA